jgi:hypothetical protein
MGWRGASGQARGEWAWMVLIQKSYVVADTVTKKIFASKN